jgi:ribosome-associated translation inhibitor RaiA
MNHLTSYEGIKTDIQTVGVELNTFLHSRIKNMISKLKKLWPEANFIDVYVKQTIKQSSYPRKINVRFGVPGPDLVASEVGYNWKTLLKSVEKKLAKQLNKRKRTI